MKVLLGYASAHGSTAEIAKEIGQIVKGYGLDVTVEPIQDVQNIESYDAFIFGTAIHAGTWLPELTTFLRKSLSRIGNKPTYFFITCVRVMEVDGPQHVMEFYMIPEILQSLNVRNKAAFAGKLALNSVDWNERWTLAARYDGSTWPNNFDGDFRDWNKIQSWASKISVDALQLEETKPKS
jgi:menaquinone-dependent protoporphyrinogen oxidase